MPGENSTPKRKAGRTSYIISVASIAMALVMLGLQGVLFMNLRAVSSENNSFSMTLFFRDSVENAEVLNFKKGLEKISEIKEVRYTSKEQAAKEFQQDIGEDFVEFIGYNPMPASLNVIFRSDIANEVMLRTYENKWMENPVIENVIYPKNLITSMSENIKNLGWIFSGLGLLLALIAVTLINNTIRISIHSNRFLIKTMQMAGATQGFIRRPFLRSGFYQGLLGGILSLIVIGGIIWIGENNIPGLTEMRSDVHLVILAGILLSSGILLSLICTFFAVHKYLNLKTDSLY